MARKIHSPDPEQAASAASEETSGDFAKTDKECCGPCPPPKQRCPTKVEEVISRMVIPNSKIASSIGGPVSIDEIEISKVTISSLKLNDFKGDFTFDSCTAKDVDLTISLELSFNFDCDISIDWLPDPHASGGMTFNIDDTYMLGDIKFFPSKNSNLNLNEKFSMQSQFMSMDFSMTSKPVRETTVDEITTGAVKMKCTSIPLETPLGMDLGVCLPVQNPMDPNDVITEETNIKIMDSKKISCPRVEINGTSLLNINIPAVTVAGFEVTSTTRILLSRATPQPSNSWGDASRAENLTGNYTVTIKKVTINVRNGLEFNNVKGSVTTGSAISDKIDDIDLVLKGIKIKGLNLCGMKIPEIEVEF